MFSSNTTFLITGGSGFIGSNLVEVLLSQDVYVKVLDNFSTGKEENLKSNFNHPKLTLIKDDILNLDICQKACEGVDYVLHHAALGSVPRSINDPLATLNINVAGTLNMLIASRDQKVKRFIYASSSSVYGDEPTLPKKEGIEGNLLSPYAVSKMTNELYAQNFYTTYGLETIGLRYFNVFGKRQDPFSIYPAVIPIFVKKLLKSESPIIFGDGKQSRDFTHIDNVIDANIKACLAPKDACGQVYNIACGEQTYLFDLYQTLCDLLGKNVPPSYENQRRGDIKHSKANIEKAKKFLNYKPQTSLINGLKKTISWYKENL